MSHTIIFKLFLLAFCVNIVIGSNNDLQSESTFDGNFEFRSALEGALLKGFLEQFRGRMSGTMFGIPPLDPFGLDSLSFQYQSLAAEIKSFRMENLSTYIIDDADFNLDGLSFMISATVPHAVLSGDYTVSGKFLSFKLNSGGPFTVDVNNAHIYITGSLSYNEEFSLSDLNININLSTVKTNFKKIVKNSFENTIINGIIGSAVPNIFNTEWSKIEPKVTEPLKKLITKKLKGKTLMDLIKAIYG